MESVLSRYRNLVILVGVLFLQVLGLAVQGKRSGDAQDTRLIRIWAVGAVTPMEKAVVALQNSGGNLWRNYLYLRGVRAENRQLKEQIEQMRLEQVRLNEDAAQARRLQSLLAFKEQYISKTVAAQVIGSIPTDLSRGIYIDKGSDHGVQPDMAVITVNGIVGKVLRVFPSSSLVLLINDQTSGVGAVLEKSRLQGVLRGTPNGEVVLDRVMSDEQVSPGETVLTSGGDQIFSKGLPVGTIAKVGAAKDLFLNITVKPSANLDKLEEVLVVLQKQEKQAVAEDVPRARAAPATPATAGAKTPAAGTAPPAAAGTVPTAQASRSESGGQVSSSAPNSSAGTTKLTTVGQTIDSKKSVVVPQTAKQQDSKPKPKSSAAQPDAQPPSDPDTPH